VHLFRSLLVGVRVSVCQDAGSLSKNWFRSIFCGRPYFISLPNFIDNLIPQQSSQTERLWQILFGGLMRTPAELPLWHSLGRSAHLFLRLKSKTQTGNWMGRPFELV
jgi:hypothetical protein